MKTIILTLALTALALMANAQDKYCDQQMVEKLASFSGNDATYLKDFVAYMPAGFTSTRYNIVLSKNTIYRISFTNSEKFAGTASLKIVDINDNILTYLHQNNRQEPVMDDIIVKETKVYSCLVESNGKETCAAIVISYVRTSEVSTTDEKNVSENKYYGTVDFNATFQGSDINSFKNYVSKNLKISSDISNNPPSDKVYIEFSVTSEGVVTNVRVARSSGNVFFDNEAVRTILSSPKWEPAKIGDKKVGQTFTLPVKYSK
jgi:TonB family protein